jgi:hypothetical protein
MTAVELRNARFLGGGEPVDVHVDEGRAAVRSRSISTAAS